jgi:hypothetical protein
MTAIAASRATMSYRSSGNVDQRVGIVEAEVVAVVDVPSVGMTGGAAAGSMMTVRVKVEVRLDWWLPTRDRLNSHIYSVRHFIRRCRRGDNKTKKIILLITIPPVIPDLQLVAILG